VRDERLALGQLLVVRSDEPAVAEGKQVLRRIEAVRSQRAAPGLRADGLRRVLDERMDRFVAVNRVRYVTLLRPQEPRTVASVD